MAVTHLFKREQIKSLFRKRAQSRGLTGGVYEKLSSALDVKEKGCVSFMSDGLLRIPCVMM